MSEIGDEFWGWAAESIDEQGDSVVFSEEDMKVDMDRLLTEVDTLGLNMYVVHVPRGPAEIVVSPNEMTEKEVKERVKKVWDADMSYMNMSEEEKASIPSLDDAYVQPL